MQDLDLDLDLDLGLDLQNGPRPNLNMLIESPIATLYFMATIMQALSFIVWEIFTIKICMTLTDTFKRGKGQT